MMLEVTVKTLDGKNKSFCVPDDITVKEFKVKIANSIAIAADSQRLIFQGRVLQDEKKLDDYDVNGSVLHVVERAPPGARGSAADGASTSTSGANYMQGSFSMTSGAREAGEVQSFWEAYLEDVENAVEQVLSGMGEMGRNAQVSTRSNADGSTVEVHINMAHVGGPPQVQSGSQLRIDQARRMVRKANKALHKLENPRDATEEGGSGRHSPMEQNSEESSSENATAQPEEGATAEVPPAAESAENEPSAETNQPEGAEAPDPNQPRRLRHPGTNVLAELLQQVMELNTRLEPHLERYHRITHEDTNYQGDDDGRRDAQRVQNRVSQALHYIAHAYHHISDLMIDMGATPPRQVRAPPTSIIQQGPAGIRRSDGVAPAAAQGSSASSTGTSTSTSATASSSSSTSGTNTTASSQAGPMPPLFGGIPFPPGVNIQIGGGGGIPGAPNPAAPGSGGPFTATFLQPLGPHAVSVNSIEVVATTVPGPHAPTAAPTGTAPSTSSGSTSQASTGPQSSPTAATGFRLPAGSFSLGPLPFMRGAPTGGLLFSPRQNGGPSASTPSSQAQAGQTPGSGRMPGMPMGFSFPPGMPGMSPPFMAPPTTSSASASTSQSGTQSTQSQAGQGQQSSQQPQGPMGFMIPGPVAPGMLPGMPAGMPPGFMAIPAYPGGDRLLPCQSRHIISQRAQAHGTGNATGEEGGLGNMVNEIMMGILRQQNPHLNAEGLGTTQAAGSRPTATAGANPGQQPGADLSLIQAMRNILQQGNQAPRSSTATSSTATATTTSAAPSASTSTSTSTSTTTSTGSNTGASEMLDEVFAQLFQGISGYVAQAATGQQPISDFLTSIGQSYSVPQGEGLLTDIFNCVTRTLTFTDLMAVFNGEALSLGRLRDPLRELITVHVLENQPMNDENVNTAITRLMEDVQPEVDAACADVEGKDDIDYKATVNTFCRHYLKLLIDMIMTSNETEAEFGTHLYTTCRSAIRQFAALSQHCLRRGRADVVHLVEGRVRAIFRDVNPVIQHWMVRISSQLAANLADYVSSEVAVSEFERFIVRRATMEASPGGESSDNSYMSADETPQTSNKAQEVPACNGHSEEVMDVDASPGAAAAEVDLSPGGSGIPAEVRARLPPPPVPNPADDTPVALGSADWHSQVPRDWVPVITRDANRQRRQAESQGPFSDAYMNGMSAKRRRIVAHQRADQMSAMGDMKRVVPDAIKKAAQSVGVEPITSHEQITRDVAANATLCSAFEDQICDSVQQRLDKDPDFIPEKYPKSDKFFNKK